MENVMEAKTGEVIWIELYMKERESAKSFYSALFGWSAEDRPMGPDAYYTMFFRGSDSAGGAFPLTPEMLSQGVPPAWMIYLRVDDIAGMTDRAKELGGEIAEGPNEIPGVGHMTLLKDPAGAHVCLFQPGQHRGLTAWGEDRTVCWIEHRSAKQPAAREFYSKLFGWTFDEGHEGYQHVVANGQQIGGLMTETQAPPHWALYFKTPDIEADIEKLSASGGTVVMKPISIAANAKIAWLTDAQGAHFGLYWEPR
jgi:predicted enzyme related to lactoylglutathione lyase